MESIRPATPADILSIARLGNRDAAWINAIRPRLARGQLGIFLASQANQPIGYAIFQPRFVSSTPVTGWRSRLACMRRGRAMATSTSLLQPMRITVVQDIFVRPAYRRRGIGTALIAHGIEYAQTSGIDDIRVNLAVTASELEPFYQRLGFLPIQAYLTKSLTSDASASLPHATEPSRPATPRDAEPLAILLHDAIHYQQTLTCAFQLRTDIDWQAHSAAKLTQPDIHLRVIEQDGDIAAFVELRLFRLPARLRWQSFTRLGRRRPNRASPSTYGVVQDIYVSPQLRRRGLASMLLQDAHRWFHAHAATHVRAAIWQENHRSFNLFHEAGYEIDERVLKRG